MNTQPPVLGSTRHRRAMTVGQWLRRYTGRSDWRRYRFSYQTIAGRLGLSVQQVQKAVYDLKDHYPDQSFIISTPCAANGYTVECGWRRPAVLGLVSDLRSAATRQASVAEFMERVAHRPEASPGEALMFETTARRAREIAWEERQVVELLLNEENGSK